MTSNLGRKVFLVTEKLAFARIAMSKLSNTQEMSILTQISTGSGDCCMRLQCMGNGLHGKKGSTY